MQALNNPSFEIEEANIYPISKKTTESYDMVSYLDIRITIVGQYFTAM